MTAIKTQVGSRDAATETRFEPSAGITATNVQQAIESAATLGVTAWGAITGTVSDQTDLQAELDGKLDVTTAAASYQPLDAELTSLSGASANGVSLVTAADYAAMRALLDVEAGTDFLSPAAIAAGYQPLDADLTAWAGVNPSSYSTTAQIAAAYQPIDADLTAIAGLSSADSNIIVGSATGWVVESGATARTSLGLGTGDSPTFTAVTVGNTGLTVGTSTPFSDAAGTLTLQNVDAIDATTEATIESAIDTLANLTSIQGRTVTLADAGANAIFGWDDTAGAYENLTAAEATATLNAFTGDAGAGGLKGLAPAPVAGDATKFLKGDGTWSAIPGGGDALTTNPLSQFAATTSLQLKNTISDETGSGALVFATSPTLVTPVLGTPSSGTLTSCTGLPISTGVSGLGTGIATALAVNTGSAGAPVLFNGALGTPASGTLTNATGLPISTGVSGLGTNVATRLAINNGIREVLTAARTYYVRTDGSDSNTGLVNSAGGGFLTLAKAWTVICALDLNTFTATIQVADGTYTGGISTAISPTGGQVTIQGNSGTPANVVISVTSSNCFGFTGPLAVPVTIKDMKLQTTTSGSGIRIAAPGVIYYSNLDFGALATFGLFTAAGGANIFCQGNYAISGAAAAHFVSADGGTISCDGPGITITITGTPAITTFSNALRRGGILARSLTFSGATTGTRYSATMNGIIETGGGGANYFPGNAAGSTATGGQYA